MTDPQHLALVRALHTAIYIVMASACFALFYAALSGASGWWVWLALVLVVIESVIFIGSGMACPLTATATRYGAKHGHDTYFPETVTRHTLAFFGPLIIVSIILLAARWAGFLA